MTPAEKMAARANGTTAVTVHEAPPLADAPFDPLDPLARLRLKQARHAAVQAKATKPDPAAEVPAAKAAAVVEPVAEATKPSEADDLAALEAATKPDPAAESRTRGNRR